MRNRRYSYLFFVLFVGPFCTAQTVSPDKNAVIHYQARTATTNPNALVNNYQNAAVTIQYMDGLGRPVQTVGYRATPTGKDLLQQSSQYDNYGRQERVYLPSPATSTSGGYQTNVLSLGQGFYNGDTHPYNQINQFDNSPLNRVKQNYGAGQAWQTNNKYTQTFYETAGSDVRRYTLNSNGNVDLSGVYPSNSLYKTRQIDEQGHMVIEIKDKQGRVVERHQQDDSGFMVTHYLYDGLDRPVAIIQPQGYKNDIVGTGFPKNGTPYQNYVFAYEYDVRGRIGRKHIPGGGWTSFVYDKTDRPVLEQTEHQAQSNRWSFVKYDAFGRVILTGELVNGNDRTTLQGNFDGVATPFETWNGSSYSNQSFPISYNPTDVRQTNYYDSYSGWRPLALKYESNGAYNSTAQYANARGMLTGSEQRSTEDNTKTFLSVMYYDNRGRVVQTYQTHHKGGFLSATKPVRTDYEYNFAGEILKEKVSYKIDGLPDTETLTTNEYDHVGRILKVFHSINGATTQELCRYGYDEIGRLTQKVTLPNGTYLYGGTPDYITRSQNPNTGIDDLAKKAVTILPNTEINGTYSATIDPNAPSGTPINGLQTIDYSYHIRGMLRGMNLDGSGNAVPKATEGDLFSFKLDYETAGFYDGNIGKQTWAGVSSSGVENRSYTYSYDPAKRLKSADYTGVNGENYSIPVSGISYDKNGNITNLQRNGKTGSGFGAIDNLNYTYSGNRLTTVTDASGQDAGLKQIASGAYTYYPDGSLKSDANEGIQDIIYDTFLKQPTEVLLTDGSKIQHFYDGGGKLLKTVYYDAGDTVLETWEYVGGTGGVPLIFKNGQFYQMSTPDGRAVYSEAATQWEYEFEYKDHLGNTRVSFKAENGQLVKTAETAFDPWGLKLTGVGSVNGFQNRWEMQGHESEKTFGLNRVNFGARIYNPAIGRFDRIDAFSEEYLPYSPYNYVLNNPIIIVDPDGNKPLDDFIFDQRGDFVRIDENDKPDKLVIEHSETGVRQNYSFADPEGDTQQIRDGIINKIIFVEQSEIKDMLSNQGAFNPENKDNWLNFYKKSKGGQDFDYSFSVIPSLYGADGASSNPLKKPSSLLFLPKGDNMVHNHMNFGNYLWAASGFTLGFSSQTLQRGGHVNSLINPRSNHYSPQWDSEDDQRSIIKGANYSRKNGFRRILQNTINAQK
jgi:RHS repeat-associated protein